MRIYDSGGIARLIAPSDTAIIKNCKAIRCDVAGVLRLKWGNEPTAVLNVVAGEVIPVIGSFKVTATTTGTYHGFFDTAY